MKRTVGQDPGIPHLSEWFLPSLTCKQTSERYDSKCNLTYVGADPPPPPQEID